MNNFSAPGIQTLIMSNEFWTDERVKEFYHILFDKYYNTGHSFESALSDYKASKQPIRDWGIEAFLDLTDPSTPIRTIKDPHHNYKVEDFINNPKYVIYSVKRLTDKEVFSIGDEIYSIRNPHKNKIKIESIKLINEVQIYLEHCPLEFAHHVKQLLFTTEDNKPIYKGTTYVIVELPSYKIRKSIGMDGAMEHINQLYFSTEDSAKEYIIHKKQLFSLDEIIEASIEKRYGFYQYDEAKLIHLAKQKLSI